MSGMTPNDCWSPRKSGVHFVPNTYSCSGTSPKKAIVSVTSDRTIRTVVTTDTSAAARRATLMADSPRERAEGARTRLARTPVAPGAAARAAPGDDGSERRATLLRAALGLLERGLGVRGLLAGHRDDLGRLGDRALVGDHEVHERLDLGALHRRRARVHEQRARERLVAAVLDRLRARLDAVAAAAGADAHEVQLVLVLLEVGEAEVPEAALVLRDAGDELVVVLGGLVVLARHALLAVDLAGEEVERARVGARPVEGQLRVGKRGVDLLERR